MPTLLKKAPINMLSFSKHSALSLVASKRLMKTVTTRTESGRKVRLVKLQNQMCRRSRKFVDYRSSSVST